jgi:hypothetical protein
VKLNEQPELQADEKQLTRALWDDLKNGVIDASEGL